MDHLINRITEPNVTCENCGESLPIGDMEFDERAENHLCGRKCFDEWHDENLEVVGDYYYQMNVDY